MNAASVITLGPANKAEIESFAIHTITQIQDGEYSPLELFIKCKAFKASLDLIIEGIESDALAEAEKNGRSFNLHQASINIREVGSRWFFDKTNDPIITKIAEEKAAVAEREKERQAFLKTLKSATLIVDEETGEAVKIYPARKESKTGLVVSF